MLFYDTKLTAFLTRQTAKTRICQVQVIIVDVGAPHLVILYFCSAKCIQGSTIPVLNENLAYIAVKPSASISRLRQKVWYLLDLPDYCEELIILKSPGDVEIALTELRKGNDPQRPYILEVWSPGMRGDCKKQLHTQSFTPASQIQKYFIN